MRKTAAVRATASVTALSSTLVGSAPQRDVNGFMCLQLWYLVL